MHGFQSQTLERLIGQGSSQLNERTFMNKHKMVYLKAIPSFKVHIRLKLKLVCFDCPAFVPIIDLSS